MHSLARLLLAGLGAGALTLAAQTTYTDDFSVDYGNWDTDVTALGGQFTVSGGALHFTDGGVTSGQTSSAYRDFNFSPTAGTDWQVQVDFNLSLPPVANGQIAAWSLYTASLTAATPDDYFVAELNQNFMQAGYRILNGTQYTDDSVVAGLGPASLAAGRIGVQIAYDAAAETLTLGYDENAGIGGYSFTTVDSVSTATWLMASTDEFGFRLLASNQTTNAGTNPINLTESYADSFSLTVAVIPEPAATAVLLGALALFIGLGRRRN